MHYIIETEYVGPNYNDQPYILRHRYEISTRPARGNMSGDVGE